MLASSPTARPPHLVLALLLAPACGRAPAVPPATTPATSATSGAAPAAPPAPPPYASAAPIREPRLFAADVVSSEAPEFSASFEPDGRTLYFNRTSADRKQLTIHVARWTGDRWTSAVAPFSGTHRDIDPFITPDGRRLYFSSDRPRPGAPDRTDYDLWYLEREGTGWSEPRHVAGAPNDAENIGFVSLTQDGTLYFDAFRGPKRSLFRSAPLPGGGFAAPEPLTSLPGTNPMVAPDGSFLVFASRLLEGNLGESDLYLARRNPDGTWGAPRHLGPAINSPLNEFAPGLTPDGRYLFFTSERPGVAPAVAQGRPPGDLYQIELSALPGS